MTRAPMKFLLVMPLALGLIMAASTPAAAQSGRPGRPYRGLFAGGTGNWGQSLIATAAAGAGWDTDIAAALLNRRAVGGGARVTQPGSVEHITAGLSYSLARERVTASAAAGSGARYILSYSSQPPRQDYAQVAVSGRLVGGLSAQGHASYRPYTLLRLLEGAFGPATLDSTAPELDVAAAGIQQVQYGGNLAWAYGRGLSRRASYSFSANAGYEARGDAMGQQADQQVVQQAGQEYLRTGARTGVRYNLAKGLGVRVGYDYNEFHFLTRDRVRRTHGLTAGIDFNRGLSISLSRRTTLSFSVGAVAAARPRLQDTRARLFAVGNAVLEHEIGRTWAATAAYDRGVRVDPTWDDLIFSDSVSLRLGGLITRRLRFESGARTSRGRIGFDSSGGFNASYANAGLTFALSRYAGLGATYLYYYHRFAEGVALPLDFPSNAERHSLRVQVSVWAPLFHRLRRP